MALNEIAGLFRFKVCDCVERIFSFRLADTSVTEDYNAKELNPI